MNELNWLSNAVFYHIYPLGCLGATNANDFSKPHTNQLTKLSAWIPHLIHLGVNAVYLGPVFESSCHGYDTADYFSVDRRLGSNEDLTNLTKAFESHGIKVILDAVFHHTGRDFWAFKDIQKAESNSPFKSWFHIDFHGKSPYGDPFAYEGWNNHYDLVKLNVQHPEVKQHLFAAVESWINDFWISGLRLDAADALDREFQRELVSFCKTRRPDFWLMGEVVGGDYRNWTQEARLDSVTNYELYKGLWSSHNDINYFEIAYSLNREFGEGGIYRDFLPYNFADNHDVERVASILKNPAHLYPLHLLLFTAPGIPSIYYGSEFGIEGKKMKGSDASLRPSMNIEQLPSKALTHPLYEAIRRFIALRRQLPALQKGGYRQLLVKHEQLVFERSLPDEKTIIAVNAATEASLVDFPLPGNDGKVFHDLLNEGKQFTVQNGRLHLPLDSCWGRVLIMK
jgi:cyclomaltodextrinase / maltogenic alpha-amylase / neopullulanase